nr:uncharacterized GPI-anchored protein At4g28100-like isoform X2 [Ipomoea trifida]
MRVKFSGKSMKMEVYVVVFMVFMLCFCGGSFAGLLSQRAQPLDPDDNSNPNTVPAFPVQSETQTCRLDLSDELFGGVSAACGRDLDRSRCCPVLAAWLFAAHARAALQISAAAPPSGSDLPMVPDDNQKCVNSLQTSLQSRNIHLPQPNASCDAVLCFCGIRLHQITSLTCSAAFNLTAPRNSTPTAALANLERNCHNASYSGCTKCLGALQKVNTLNGGGAKNGTHKVRNGEGAAYDSDRVTKMLNRDCQLMGLTWLLARNKTAYIPTVSAVLRAIMYSAHPPHDSKCSPDQENMPLAVNSLQFEKSDSSSSSSASSLPIFFRTLPLLILGVNILLINY